MRRLSFAEVMDASLPLSNSRCFSIYLPPTSVHANPKERDSSLRSLVNDLKSLSANTESLFSKHLNGVIRSIDDVKFIQEKHGLAWFVSEKVNGYLPANWSEEPFAVVSDSFHVKPLLRDLQLGRPFFVLSVSGKEVKLFYRWYHGLDLIEHKAIEAVKKSKKANFRRSHERSRQKLRQKQVTIINRMLHKHLSSSDDPLVLTGTTSTINGIRSSIEYPTLLEKFVASNPRTIDTGELSSEAYKIAQEYFRAQEDLVIEDLKFCQKSKKALNLIEEVSVAAVDGRISTLVIPVDYHCWGILNKETGAIEFRSKQRDSEDGDVLDDISELVLKHKGKVWVIEEERLPEAKVFATLRW